jgi:arylsulfatase A-like enzyme
MKPNILFLTIDSLRADKCYGKNKSSKTPNLGSLINQGIYFNQAISTSDQTGTSIASIYTGLFPTRSGLTEVNFPKTTSTFLDIFAQNGYQVNCFFPDLSFFKNLASKFTEKTIYDFENKDLRENLDDGLGAQIVDQIKSNKMKKPWLFCIHLMDMHVSDGEFLVPEEFDNENYGSTKYDRLLSFIDDWISNILKEIDLKDTLVILSSDHGEYIPVTGKSISEIPKVQNAIRKGTKSVPFLEKIGMKAIINLRFAAQTYRKEKLKRELPAYEMRSFNTRSALDLYDELVRVPLIFTGFNVGKPKVIPDLVRHVDIFTTIADISGISYEKSDMNGRSLLPLVQEKKLEELPAYIEVGINLAQLLDKKNPNTNAKVIGIRTSEFKYYRYRDNPTKFRRLFDLKNDPLEKNNIVETNVELRERMEKMLTGIIKESNKNKSKNLSEEEIKKARDVLMKLGYI